MESSKNRILLIENYRASYRSRVKKYKKVFVFSGKYIKAENVPQDFLTRAEYYQAYRKAGALIDQVFKKYFNSSEISVLNKVIQDGRAELIVKKQVLMSMKDIFLSLIFAEKFIHTYNINSEIDFIPKEFPFSLYQVLSENADLLSRKIKIPSWYLIKRKQDEVLKNILFRLSLLIYPVSISLMMSVGKNQVRHKKKFKFGMFLWDSALDLPVHPGIDLLVNGNNLNRNEILFFADNRISKKNLAGKIKKKGYNYWYFKEKIGQFSLREYLRNIFPAVLKMAKSLFWVNSRNMIINQAYLRSLVYFIMWEVFYAQYHVETFIYVQEVGNVQRVIYQKKYGSKNVFVFLSTSFNLAFNEGNERWGDSDYSFMIYDVIVSSRMSNDYFKEHHNQVKEYFDFGIFYSDLVYKIKHDSYLRNELKNKFAIPPDKIVLGLFDTGIGRMLMFKENEGLQMLTDVIRLLESDDRYFMLYKAREDSDFSKDSAVGLIFNKLVNHGRVFFVNKFIANDYYRSQLFMGISDLVIGAFGSSVPMEAVAGGVMTICYTPTERFGSEKFILNTFPRFCARNYKELEEFSDYWLNHCSEKDFSDFQNQYIKKHVDSHCDGKAFNRLYEFLKNGHQTKKIT